MSSQLDLTGVPDDEFFLVAPRGANTAAPLPYTTALARPQAQRVMGETQVQASMTNETRSISSSGPSSLFVSIEEDWDTDDFIPTRDETLSPSGAASFDLIDEEEAFLALTGAHESHGRQHLNHDDEYLHSLDEQFINIERSRTGTDLKLPAIRLKPRPASLRDGQRSLESFSSFAMI